jgi:phosphoribosylformylglycinamidine (FGAM) synthase-like enzyme
VLLGTTREEFGGSAWAHVRHGHLGGLPPAVDLDSERILATLLASAASAGLLASAHDLSDGGLAVSLAESCLRGGHGCSVSLSGDTFTELFSESVARAVVSVTPGREEEFAAMCASVGVPAAALGIVGGDSLTVTADGDAGFAVPLGDLSSAWTGTLPALFD